MKIVDQDAEYALIPVLHALGKDSESWDGWRALRLTANIRHATARAAARAGGAARAFLDSALKDKEGMAFFCGDDAALVFCRDMSATVLAGLGEQIVEIMTDEGVPRASYTLYDVRRDAQEIVAAHSLPTLTPSRHGMKAAPTPAFIPPGDGGAKPHAARGGAIASKVLLVEDDPVTRWAVRRALKDDCELSTAADGVGALAAYQACTPDVVLLDINLPGRNGKEVLAEIIQSDPGANIVVFSGQNDMEHIVDMLESGARGFIAKPFTKDRLRRYVTGRTSKS